MIYSGCVLTLIIILVTKLQDADCNECFHKGTVGEEGAQEMTQLDRQ